MLRFLFPLMYNLGRYLKLETIKGNTQIYNKVMEWVLYVNIQELETGRGRMLQLLKGGLFKMRCDYFFSPLARGHSTIHHLIGYWVYFHKTMRYVILWQLFYRWETPLRLTLIYYLPRNAFIPFAKLYFWKLKNVAGY